MDVFISHASEDIDAVAKPLADRLVAEGLKVWYDGHSLRLGNSLRREIDRALSSCRFGVVILSEAFFAKEWPKRELDALAVRELSGRHVILPIWHNVDFLRVASFSPFLADRYAIRTEVGLEAVAREIIKVVGFVKYSADASTVRFSGLVAGGGGCSI